jgi:hypothetical protein
MRKHHRAAQGKGVITVAPHSGLRKLMRAARRGKIPDERLVVMEAAAENAAKRPLIYMNSMARGWAVFKAARFQ